MAGALVFGFVCLLKVCSLIAQLPWTPRVTTRTSLAPPTAHKMLSLTRLAPLNRVNYIRMLTGKHGETTINSQGYTRDLLDSIYNLKVVSSHKNAPYIQCIVCIDTRY